MIKFDLKKSLWWVILLGFFFLTRVYILKFPPPFYSDVTHDYERYANMWHYGLTPYLKHFYEYPPATLPLLWLPLIVDQWGVGHYYFNYRVGIFFLDTILFLFILKALQKLPDTGFSKMLAVLFYLFAPVIAKDFFYEGIDLAFIGSLTIGLISLLLWSKNLFSRVFFWAMFWLSFAIKFMSAPLLAVFFYLKGLKFKQEIIALGLGFVLIWGAPLAIFRSSLAVSFVFHAKRPLKYASFPSFIVDMINQFTQSETRIDEPPDFQLVGPVSSQVQHIFGVVFPLSIGLVLLYGLGIIFRPVVSRKNWKKLLRQLFHLATAGNARIDPFVFGVKITLIYIFTLFLTGKIFSQPFHIWYIPLLTIFPFKGIKQQAAFLSLALWLLIVDTTPWIKIDESANLIGPLTVKVLTYSTRFIPMMTLLALSFCLPNKLKKK